MQFSHVEYNAAGFMVSGLQAYIQEAGLLPAALTDDDIKLFYLRSDDSSRTIMSGQALFSGMYPAAVVNLTTGSRAMPWLIRDGGALITPIPHHS